MAGAALTFLFGGKVYIDLGFNASSSDLLVWEAVVTSSAPTLSFVFEASVTLGDPVELGASGGNRRRFIPITGGRVTGPSLEAEILAGGGDWQELHEDGRTSIHARYMLRTRDGAMIAIDNPGIRVAPPEINARLAAGEEIDPALYYFRTTPRFDVAPGPHAWLTRAVFLCQGIRLPGAVLLRFFRVD